MAPGYFTEQARWYTSSAAESAAQVKAAPGRLLYLAISNSNAGVQYAYVFDNASANSGTLLLPPLAIPAVGHLVIDLTKELQRPATAGIRVAQSSTQATFTLAGGTEFRISAAYL